MVKLSIQKYRNITEHKQHENRRNDKNESHRLDTDNIFRPIIGTG